MYTYIYIYTHTYHLFQWEPLAISPLRGPFVRKHEDPYAEASYFWLSRFKIVEGQHEGLPQPSEKAAR